METTMKNTVILDLDGLLIDTFTGGCDFVAG